MQNSVDLRAGDSGIELYYLANPNFNVMRLVFPAEKLGNRGG
jgi:hypothetical protein